MFRVRPGVGVPAAPSGFGHSLIRAPGWLGLKKSLKKTKIGHPRVWVPDFWMWLVSVASCSASSGIEAAWGHPKKVIPGSKRNWVVVVDRGMSLMWAGCGGGCRRGSNTFFRKTEFCTSEELMTPLWCHLRKAQHPARQVRLKLIVF
jgi:hypothetical protein